MRDAPEPASEEVKRRIREGGERARAEAEARKKAAAAAQPSGGAALPKEVGGRDGPDPARYGDWEVKGVASDF
jgi:hypothetical protein